MKKAMFLTPVVTAFNKEGKMLRQIEMFGNT